MPEDGSNSIVVIGAGMGGLAAALALGAAGYQVDVLEAAPAPGGKLRQVMAGERGFDAGPTVMTMKWVFDDLLARLGTSLEDEIGLVPSSVLARHYWSGGERLDLFADPEAGIEAVRAFAGPREADGYARFQRDSARIFSLLKTSFIDASRPDPVSLSRRIGLARPASLFALKPFSTLWSALGSYFADPRLRQLFGRYATYCGSSPYQAPATLMLVAHVEQAGVWTVDGGMHALALRLASVAGRLGVVFHYSDPVADILTDPDGRAVTGVVTASGKRFDTRNVVYNGDVSALGRLLDRPARAPAPTPPARRSLSAMVACDVARAEGVPLAHHTVFFSDDYKAEFDAIFRDRRAPADPTIYVCAQDRDAEGNLQDGLTADGAERLYCLMNLPADGDRHAYDESERQRCLDAMDNRLQQNGLTLRRGMVSPDLTTPDRFTSLFPGSGGALYGMASHGWMASFSRLGSKGPVRGLYLAGGSVHPGPGVPMAALSGKLAADRLMADLALTGRSRPVATTGGMPMRSAIAGATPSR